jgi:uncharacterized coiled-coil DUF342 family protein
MSAFHDQQLARLAELRAARQHILDAVAPLEAERDALRAKIAPLEAELRELHAQVTALERGGGLQEISREIVGLIKALGPRVLSLNAEPGHIGATVGEAPAPAKKRRSH